MLIKKIVCRSLTASMLVLACATTAMVRAQTPMDAQTVAPQKDARPIVIQPEDSRTAFAAKENDLYCGGFIQYAPSYHEPQIVGGEQEQEQRVYSAGNTVFIDAGSAAGVRVGQEFSVIRPRGEFKTKLSNKKGSLGVYTQEVGHLRVTNVKERVSVAQIVTSCETILLGDLLRPATQRVSPERRMETTFDRFRDPSGKQTGRLVLARDGREAVATNEVVFVDLGTEDNIKKGDYLTIYRPAGTGNITRFRDEEVVPETNGGFESRRFKGGQFSNQAQRVKDLNSPSGVSGRAITSPEIKRVRPPVPRKVVGELVIIGVEQRTATAIITRAAQEVHTGDFVELQ